MCNPRNPHFTIKSGMKILAYLSGLFCQCSSSGVTFCPSVSTVHMSTSPVQYPLLCRQLLLLPAGRRERRIERERLDSSQACAKGAPEQSDCLSLT